MPGTKKELIAEARKRKIYSRKMLGKPVSAATKKDLAMAIKNDKERKRRKLKSIIAKSLVAGAVAGTFGAGAVQLRKSKRNVQRARGAIKVVDENDLIEEILEQLHDTHIEKQNLQSTLQIIQQQLRQCYGNKRKRNETKN